MSAQPLISVVLPSYNRHALLKRAMQSVLGQTHRHLELIVVDDGSTDATPEMLSTWADSRLVVVRRSSRSGPASARNHGLERARGEFIAFQDSDDEWLTTKLEQQLRVLQSDADVGLALCSYLVHERDRVRLVRSDELVRGSGYEAELLWGYPVATPAWLVRRDVLEQAGAFDSTLPCLEDWDLCFRLHALCRFRAVAEPLLVKYGHADSISADPKRHLQGLRAILERHAALWRRHPAHEARLLREIGLLECQYISRRSGIASLVRAITRRPFSAGLYWSLAAATAGRGAWRSLMGSTLRRTGRDAIVSSTNRHE